MNYFVVTPVDSPSYAVRFHRDHSKFDSSFLVTEYEDGRVIFVSTLQGTKGTVPSRTEWMKAAREHFPKAEIVRYKRMMDDGEFREEEWRIPRRLTPKPESQ